MPSSRRETEPTGTQTPEPGLVGYGPQQGKKRSFFFTDIVFLFNDDLICIYFIDTKKNLGELSCWIEVSFGLEESETPFSGLSNHMRQSKTQTY